MIQPTPEEQQLSWLLEIAEGIHDYSKIRPKEEVIRAFSEIKTSNLGKPSTVSEWEVFIACAIVDRIRKTAQKEILEAIGSKAVEALGLKVEDQTRSL